VNVVAKPVWRRTARSTLLVVRGCRRSGMSKEVGADVDENIEASKAAQPGGAMASGTRR